MATRPGGIYTSPVPEQGRVLPSAQQPVPQTGFFENLSAGFEEMRLVGNTYSEENRLSSGYGDLIDRVNADLPADQQFSDTARRQSIYPWEYEQRVFDVINQRRQRDPNYLPGVPATAFEYREMLRQHAAVRLQEIRRIQGGATGMGQIGGFLGSVGGGMTDSANISLMVMIPGGGARTVLGAVAREGVENALAETLLLPGTNQNYANLGEEQTASDNLRQVLLAGAGGAAFRGGHIAITHGAGAAYDRILPQIFNALPESVQQRWANAATVHDVPLTDILRATVPQDTWTPELRASVNVVERESEVAAASPFEATPTGDAAHANNLTAALHRLVDGVRPIEVAPVEAPAFRPAPQAAAAAPAPAVSSSTAAADFKARVRQRESGGNDRISNPQPGQTASGRYQFTHDTFVSLHRQVFGGSMSAEQRWAQRFDGDVQERLMDTAIAGYETVLTRAGVPVTPGNLYLSHFFGPEDAAAILRQPDRPLRDILTQRHSARYADQVFAVNPNLRRDMSGADAAALTNRAMGGRAPERSAQPDQPAAIASDGSAAEIADLEAQIAARDSAEPVPDTHIEGESAFDQPAVLRRDMFASDREWAEAQQFADDGYLRRVGARDDARTVLADAGGIRDDEGHDLINGRNLQRFVPRAGPLIRRNGMSIDEAGELLWDKGFFGPPETTPRPTNAEVLDLIERAANGRVYTPEVAADAEFMNLRQKAPGEDDLLDEVVTEIRATMLDDFDLPDDPAYRSLVAQHYGSGEYSAWGAIERATDDMQTAGLVEIRAMSGDPNYDITSFNVEEFSTGRTGREAGEGSGRSEPGAGTAGEGGTASRASSADAALRNLRTSAASGAMLDAPTLKQFDDPAGEAVRSVSDSLAHDLKQAAAENAAIAAQKFLVDEIGQEATLDAILGELNADRAAAAAIRGCL